MYGEGYVFSSKEELRKAIETSNGKANTWDVSAIKDMSFLFRMTDFNEPIDKWNTSNVTNMAGMFYENKTLNPDIRNWDVSNVTNMTSMFYDSTFNQDISNWDVFNVENMSYMFHKSLFNQDIRNWDVESVTNMSHMFDSSLFNQDISNWDVFNVKNMSYMFHKSLFNQDIRNWDVKSVTNMSHMFEYSKFNQDITRWNMRKVIHLENMFSESSMDEKNKPPLFSKEIKKKITVSISMHGENLSTKIVEGVPLHTSLAVRPGLCAFATSQTPYKKLDELKELKRIYHGKPIREGNKIVAEEFQIYRVNDFECNIEPIMSVSRGYTKEELRHLYNERTCPLRSIEYDRNYALEDDKQSVIMGIYIINAQENGHDVTFTYPELPKSIPTRAPDDVISYMKLQKTNLLNVAVAEHILPGGFPLSITEEYTNIPHYKKITLSDILLFFGKLGYDYVNIIDNACRVGVRPKLRRKNSIREHELHTRFTVLYPDTGGKTLKKRKLNKSRSKIHT
jgi:surface protein